MPIDWHVDAIIGDSSMLVIPCTPRFEKTECNVPHNQCWRTLGSLMIDESCRSDGTTDARQIPDWQRSMAHIFSDHASIRWDSAHPAINAADHLSGKKIFAMSCEGWFARMSPCISEGVFSLLCTAFLADASIKLERTAGGSLNSSALRRLCQPLHERCH